MDSVEQAQFGRYEIIPPSAVQICDYPEAPWPICLPRDLIKHLKSTDKMTAPTDTTTELMTEHLQYAPLTLIDDIINSANAILYQSMEAFETYLRDTLIPSLPPRSQGNMGENKRAFALDGEGEDDAQELYRELEFGMAQTETLLENAVDRNFDAFELYVLRNVFNVPEEVEGYLRLKHHQVPTTTLY